MRLRWACRSFLAFQLVWLSGTSLFSIDFNELSNTEKRVGWKLLFDGKTLQGWKMEQPGSWEVEDGAIACKGKGDIYSTERFGNFFLQCSFKIGSECNSGIYVRVGDPKDRSNTGFEIQILDNERKSAPARGQTGAVYDRLAPSQDAMKPVGEWNDLLVLCLDNLIKIRLNDQLIIDMDVDKWAIPYVNPDGSWNKYKIPLKEYPREGHVGIQSHSDDSGGRIWLRGVKVLILDQTTATR